MASTDARPVPRKGVAYRVTFPILDADGDLVTGATGLDSEVSKDGAAFADCTNEATEIATSSGMYFLDLTATEMDADTVAIIVKTSTSGAKTTPIVLYPEEAGDYRADMVQISGDSTAADNAEAFFDGTGYAGTNNVIPTVTTLTNAVTVGTNNDKTGYTLSAAGIQAVWDALTSALTTAGSIGKLLVDNINATISSRLASASITLSSGKVTVGTNDDKTGYSLAADQSGVTVGTVNSANVKKVNDVTLTGDGSATPWGPA